MIFETEYCAGCRSCEIACSYHHKQIFSPSISSIEIIARPERLGFDILFHNEANDDHLPCDGCKGLEEPLCVKYCNVLMRDELRKLLQETFRED